MSDRLSEELKVIENELNELREKQNLRNMNNMKTHNTDLKEKFNGMSLLNHLFFKRPNIDYSDVINNGKPLVAVRKYSATVEITYKNGEVEKHIFVSDFLKGEDLRTLFYKGNLEDNSFKELRISREVVSKIEVITKEI
ncbi:hypothetical protein [Empedobacter brevis]|uniref:hypothetical protein n=1 Tax=Empedobacter brevis TaxID=247 RepID=UPI0028AD9934|nr:hypothetical protein [Empedobacter brevis]